MSDLNVSIESNANQLALHFEQLPDAIKRQLEITITKYTHMLLSRVRAAEPVRTGRLRAATREFVDVRQDFIRGRVRILPTGKAQDVAAAFGALEYGAPGKRRAGKPVKVRGYSRAGTRIAAHTRHQPHIRARRFLRGPAAAIKPALRAELEAIIQKKLHETTIFATPQSS